MNYLKILQTEIHQNAINKGWYEKVKSVPEHIALIHSEASEALEADRNDKYCSGVDTYKMMHLSESDLQFEAEYKANIKGTFEEELADIVLRVLDLAEWKGIDLQPHIEAKMLYNTLRPHKHGGKKY